ncbi:hypothetical protein AAG570_012883 [Ranatra chinensis]|uniref:UHRF1-binding protein 1-like n=1 Tax=Ranatra chinensis TaxID=642074 RepID=A0ABD0YFQ3_9HEMI
MNSFALNLRQSFLKTKNYPASTSSYIDVKVEAILPRIVFESNSEVQYGQRDRPKSLHIQVSRAQISNVRSADSCSKADLAKCINASQLGSLFYNNEFPAKEGDFTVVNEKFIKHIKCEDSVHTPIHQLPVTSGDELISKLSKTLLWTEARDVWCINLEPLWGEFYGARGVAHNRPVPFLDAFPLKIWVHMNLQSFEEDGAIKVPDIHSVAYISSLISLQLNHYQLLFLLRLTDEFTELVTILGMDSERICRGKKGSLIVGAVIPQLEVTLVMPSQTQGKESSGADVESVIPDTSSLADDVVTNPSIQWNTVVSTNIIQDPMTFKKSTVFSTSPPSDQISIELSSPSKPKFVKQNINSVIDLQSMKKGFTNMLGSVLKTEEDIEAASIKSDGSSDSDNYIARLSGHSNDAMFCEEDYDEPNVGFEIASEVMEDEDNHSGATLSMTTPSENHSNASSYRRKDMISIATFKLGQVEVIQQSEGLKSALKMHISNVAIDECPAIPWDEFQNKFSTRSRGWSEVCEQPAERPRIRLRIEHSVQIGDPKSWIGPNNSSWFNDLLIASINNISLRINPTTIAAVADFLIDDINSPPLPLEMNLENIDLNLVEDKISGVGTPTNVSVKRLRVTRNKDGVVLIEPSMAYQSDATSNELSDLKAENEQLRRRLAAMERLNEENHYLRKCEEETHVLRQYIYFKKLFFYLYYLPKI